MTKESKKTVLVTGSNGLLGQKLTDLYKNIKTIDFHATSRGANRYGSEDGFTYHSLDISNENSVNELLLELKPDCIIHAAAMTQVDDCEEQKELCTAINVSATKYLTQAAKKIGSHFIFVSTDFIFDGKDGPYKEDAKPNPLSFYGNSKLLAEEIVQQNCEHFAILRTVLVYGVVNDMSRSNIILWAKNALENQKEISVVDDQYRTPTLAEDLALGCRLAEEKKAQGIFNISGKDFLSIYELVERVAIKYGLSMSKVNKVSSLTLNQKAQRPPITGFDLSKSRKILGYEPHNLEHGMEIVLEQMKNNLIHGNRTH